MTAKSEFQIGAALARLTPGRPLLIVDADEVILKFVEGLDRFLRGRGLYLDLSTYRLHGNVKSIEGDVPVLDVEVTALLDEFRVELDSLELVEGASSALKNIATHADIVVLTNITPEQAAPRVRNLARHGLDLPIVANSGGKGRAVKALTARSGKPSFFVDDIPQHLASAAEHAPDVVRIHLIGDKRLKALLPPAPHAHARIDDWTEAEAYIRARLDGT